MGELLLSVRGLTKVYPNGHVALDGIDLDVYRGEFVVAIGLSGSGKSTLVRCLNRLVEPTSGTIVFAGEETRALRGRSLRKLRSRMGMIFQQFNLIDRASVATNVLTGSLQRQGLGSSLLGRFDRASRVEAQELLALVGLAGYERRRADTLSGGQQQRVAIARALLQHPELILADEPVASLDPATSHSVMRHLKALQEDRGITVLANLHFLSLARAYATRVVALRAGQIVFQGSPAEIDDAKFRDIYGQDAVEVEIR